MATHNIKIKLSGNSIRNARQQLGEYKDELSEKMLTLVKRLAEEGIKVAENNTGGFGNYIEFRMETDQTKTGCKAIIIARDKQKIISNWKTKDGIKTAEVSPLLMVEYGSGKYAVDDWRGSFPGQTHAFDPHGWWYMDLSNKWHHSYGVQPLRPMYTAYQELIAKIDEIAKEVFNG